MPDLGTLLLVPLVFAPSVIGPGPLLNAFMAWPGARGHAAGGSRPGPLMPIGSRPA